MPEESKRSGKRRGIIAACGVLALAVIAGAYWLGRSTGAGGDIGAETAKSAALSHAEVTENALSSYEISRDGSGGAAVYEVKFTADGVAYDYEVSAADGSIVKFSRETDSAAPEDPAPGAAAPEDGRIGEDRAWEIALDHAGVTDDPAAGEPAKLDYEDGVLVYELKFFSGGYEYDYEISAADGSIVKFEKEAGDTHAAFQSGQSVPADAAPDYIGEARAREIALAHAGLPADAAARWDVELDHHDSRPHGSGCCEYEVSFKSGGYEYEYKIDAVTGEILEFERELDD